MVCYDLEQNELDHGMALSSLEDGDWCLDMAIRRFARVIGDVKLEIDGTNVALC